MTYKTPQAYLELSDIAEDDNFVYLGIGHSADQVAEALKALGQAGAKAGENLKKLFNVENCRPEWLEVAFEALCDDGEHVERCFAGLGWFPTIPCDLGAITSYVKSYRATSFSSEDLSELVDKLQENLNGTST